MCVASLRLQDVHSSGVGDSVMVVGSRASGKMFAKANDPSCATCVPFGAVVSFQNLPGSIRARLGVPDGEVRARMVCFDSPRTEFYTNRDDEFEQVGGRQAKFTLSELPFRTVCQIVAIQLMPDMIPAAARQQDTARTREVPVNV